MGFLLLDHRSHQEELPVDMQAHIESLRNSTEKISELMIEREREMEESKGREKRLSEKYWRFVLPESRNLKICSE